jgi:RNA polymerase sigma-70 factor (sigma-E family)
MEFDDYVAARGQSLLRFAYVLTGDEHSAEDLAQSALANAYRHWRRVSRAEHPDAYVRRIVVNTHLGFRRRKSSGERPTGDNLDGTVADHADAIVNRDASRRILDTLPPRARTVLVLRYYADLDDAAIADLLGLTPSTIRATASRALAALRQQHVQPPHAARSEETR